MVMSQESPRSKQKNTILAFTRKLGLPSTFADLEVSGLEKVINAKDISTHNKELIVRFLNHISPEVSEPRLTFYTHKLRKLTGWLQKDFENVTEQDLRSLLTFLIRGEAREKGGRFSFGTVHGYKVSLKRFYRWLEGEDEEYPRKVRWIKTSGDTTRIKEPEQILTPEEVLTMIRLAGNPRDKALISFLHESGARIAECLAIKIKHIEFMPNMVKITLPVSKTKPRMIPLISCQKHMVTWMNYHPLKDDPEAPVWSNLKDRSDLPLAPQTVSDILKKIAVKAGITKRIYPHLFRACSITHKQAEGWPEQAIKTFHGLSKDSKAMKHYSHLSYNNLEQIQRQMNGLPVEDQAELNHGIKCPACGKKNPLYAEMCSCGLPIEMKVVADTQGTLESVFEARLEKKMEEFLQNRLNYDRILERFMHLLVKKTKQSPELLKTISEIKTDLQSQHPQYNIAVSPENRS